MTADVCVCVQQGKHHLGREFNPATKLDRALLMTLARHYAVNPAFGRRLVEPLGLARATCKLLQSELWFDDGLRQANPVLVVQDVPQMWSRLLV